MTKTLIYVHDPLCGFCYGFKTAIDMVAQNRPDLEIYVALGGLSIGERIGPYSELADYIRQAAPRVTAVSGASFGAAFLEQRITSTALSSSNPPSTAILQVRSQHPDRALAFAHMIQDAHFQDGVDLNDVGLYPNLAEQLDLTDVDFDIPEPRDVPDALQEEYERTRSLNFSGFPSLFLASMTGQSFADVRPVDLSYQGEALLSTLQLMMQAKAVE